MGGHFSDASQTDSDDVQRKRNDTRDGLLSKSDFGGETEEVQHTAEAKLPPREKVQENEAGVTAPGTSKRQASRVAVDSRRGWGKQPLIWFSSKSINGRHCGYLNSGHEMRPFRRHF